MKDLRMKFLILTTFLLVSLSALAQSQTTITGTVIDEEGYGVIGATVSVKSNPANGAPTDLDGKYSIQVKDPQKDVLVFSYVGMDKQEIPVKGKTVIDVTLKSNAIELDEIVAIGYGTIRRKDLTGTVSSIKSSAVDKVPVSDVSQALVGKISGVQVRADQGSPDAGISILIRGGTSITQSNEPLYIVDGFPSEDGLRGIDPTSIESIDVLKDGATTAIYGSRGANGVVVVTTKSGQDGKATISYDMYYGTKKINKRLKLLKPADYVNLEYERHLLSNELEKFERIYGKFEDFGANYADRKGINWQDEVFDSYTPTNMMHKVGISGGNKTNTYFIAYTRNDDDGILMGSGLVRNAWRAKFTQKVTNKLSFSFNANWMKEDVTGIGSLNDGGRFSRMSHIWQYRPTIGINGDDRDLVEKDEDPALATEDGNQMQNPIASIQAEQRKKTTKSLSANAEVTYKIMKGLTYRGTVGMRQRNLVTDEFHTERSRKAKNVGGPFAAKATSETTSLTYNNTLTYDTKFGDNHSLNVMVGQEFISDSYSMFNAKSGDFPLDNHGINDMGLGRVPGKPETYKSRSKMLSYFGRVNYTLMDKYLFSAVFRTDGSSRFGKGNRWRSFPSLSAAWRASDESFIKDLNVFSNLKLRASVGTAGNNRIPEYQFLDRYVSNWVSMGNVADPMYEVKMGNKNLKWEKTTSVNLGLDFGFFNHRLQGALEFYNIETSDLLLDAQLPNLIAGQPTIQRNMGKTRNRGVELSLTSYNIQHKDFTWNTTFNISANKNKVLKLTDVDFFEKRSGWNGDFNDVDYLVKVGQPLGQMYGYVYDGIYTVDQFDYDATTKKYSLKKGEVGVEGVDVQPGYYKFKNLNPDEDNTINSKDRKVLGKASPKFFGGLGNDFTYKGFDLSIFFNFSVGGKVYNANQMYSDNLVPKLRNAMRDAKDRFTFIDDQGNNLSNDPAALAARNEGKSIASVQGVGTNIKLHSRYIEKASFLRLNNITLGYTVPKKWLNKVFIKDLRIYASGYNLATIAGYSGYDPEVNTTPNSGLTPGIDWGAYPRAQSYVFGLNISF